MQSLLVATWRLLQAIRLPGGGAVDGKPARLDVALIVATGLLVLAGAPALFVRWSPTADPTWPDASPLVRYLIAVGQALGAG